MAEDRRTTGIYFEDQNIEQKVTNAIRAKYGQNDQVQVRVTSFNRYVLLDGRGADEEIKKDIGVIALGVENVRNVQNELVVGPPTSLGERGSDAAFTTKVRGRFVSENKFQPNHVVVTTRNNVVYLMGLVTAKRPTRPPRSHAPPAGCRRWYGCSRSPTSSLTRDGPGVSLIRPWNR